MKSKLRGFFLLMLDIVLIAVDFIVCYYVCRLNGGVSLGGDAFAKSIFLMTAIYAVIILITGINNSLWRYAQPTEYFFCVAISFVAITMCVILSRNIFNIYLPMYFYLLVMSSTALALVTSRLAYRIVRCRIVMINDRGRAHPQTDGVSEAKDANTGCSVNAAGSKKRTLIVGCGDAGYNFLMDVGMHPSCNIQPAAAVDDDLMKRGKKILGLKIEGGCADIPKLCEKNKIDLIVVAIPSASDAQRAIILDYCRNTGCAVKIMPHIYDLSGGGSLGDLRGITPEELLGREPIQVASREILSFVMGKTVLITGGGGSIGSELCRQIAENNPSKLIILDIYENNAYDIQQELIRKYGRSAMQLVVCIANVREYGRIDQVMREHKPDIVIHAAAHKHVPLMENSPQEAIKNNVLGTLNLVRAADANKVEKFIMISTDKAVNPTNIMGATKRLCEMIVQTMDKRSGTMFAAVRFGNVIGSNGSVIPLFRKQIENGGPVTVTHPDIIRYFMTIPEASQLVLTAGAMAKGGEIFVLDMGNQVKILDVAKKMISLSGYSVDKDIKIEFTGLRPGEKLYEELLMDEEGIRKTDNSKIFIGHPLEIDYDTFISGIGDLCEAAQRCDIGDAEIFALIEKKLMEIVPTFRRAASAAGKPAAAPKAGAKPDYIPAPAKAADSAEKKAVKV